MARKTGAEEAKFVRTLISEPGIKPQLYRLTVDGEPGGIVSEDVKLDPKGEWRIDKHSTIIGHWRIYGRAEIYNTKMDGSGSISGQAKIQDSVVRGDGIVIREKALIMDTTIRGPGVHISGTSTITNSSIRKDVRISGYPSLDHCYVEKYAKVSASLRGVRVPEEAIAKKATDILQIGPIGSEGGTLTVFKTKDGLQLQRGCFYGTLEEFEKAVTHHISPYKEQYESVIQLIKQRFFPKRRR